MQSFAEYLIAAGLSPNTAKNYRNRVDAFIAAACLPEEYIRCGKVPETRLRFAALRKYREYQGYLERAGHDVRPIEDIEHARIRRQKAAPVPHISQKQARAIVDQAADIGARTGLVFALLYGQGLRVSEALNVRLDQVDLEGETLWVDGKGGPREMPLMPFVARAIRRWMPMRAKKAKADEPRLLVGKIGRRLGVKPVEAMARKLLEDAGVNVPVMRPCHVLRHAFARHCWEQGMDIRLIQTWLGHAELKTTERYIGVSQLRMQQARALHPLADDVRSGLQVVQAQTDLQNAPARRGTA